MNLGSRYLLFGLFVFFLLAFGQASPAGLFSSIMFVKWLSGPIILLLFVLVIAFRFSQGKRIYSVGLLPVLTFTVFVVLVTYSKGDSIALTIPWFIFYLKYFIFFNFLINLNLTYQKIEWIMGAILILAWVLLFETLIRGYVFGIRGDGISFLMGREYGHEPLGYVLIIAISIAMSRWVKSGKIKYILISILFIVPAFPGKIKALLIGGPIIILLTILLRDYFANRKLRFFNLAVKYPVVILLSGFVFYTALISYIDTDEMNLLTLFDAIRAYFVDGKLDVGQLNRLGFLIMVIQYLSTGGNLLFGFGAGASFRNQNESSALVEMVGSNDVGILGYNNQITAMIMDVGLIGLILYLWLNWLFFKHMIKGTYVRKVLNSKLRTIFFSALVLIAFYFLFSPLHKITWRYDFLAYMVFLLSAYFYRLKITGFEQEVK